jgi:uncharacterized membrane protein (UPF0127 family)
MLRLMVALAAIPPRADGAESPVPSRRRLPGTAEIVGPDGAIVCAQCVIADRMFKRMRGLLGRSHLDEGTGILLQPAPSIHTLFMRFAIDVVFLDRERKIVGISHTLRPWRVAGARRAVAALELPAGTAVRHGLAIGDILAVETE